MEVALQNVSHTNETAQHKAKTCPSTSIANDDRKISEKDLELLKIFFSGKETDLHSEFNKEWEVRK